jgi:hypothetical protein
MDFAKSFVEGTAANPENSLLGHIQTCPYCQPRFEALRSLHQLKPVAVERDPAFKVQPALDSWSGLLVAAQTLAADAGWQEVVAATLKPSARCRLADRPLYLELRWEPVREKKVRCQLLLPILGRGAAAGTPREVLAPLSGQQFMVEFTNDDPYGGWGFSTILQWDNRETGLVSPRRVLPLRGFHAFKEMRLTHLQPIGDYDLG